MRLGVGSEWVSVYVCVCVCVDEGEAIWGYSVTTCRGCFLIEGG